MEYKSWLINYAEGRLLIVIRQFVAVLHDVSCLYWPLINLNVYAYLYCIHSRNHNYTEKIEGDTVRTPTLQSYHVKNIRYACCVRPFQSLHSRRANLHVCAVTALFILNDIRIHIAWLDANLSRTRIAREVDNIIVYNAHFMSLIKIFMADHLRFNPDKNAAYNNAEIAHLWSMFLKIYIRNEEELRNRLREGESFQYKQIYIQNEVHVVSFKIVPSSWLL